MDQTAQEAARYRAFISHSSEDQAWGRWLQRELERYRVPARLVGQVTACGTINRRLLPLFRYSNESPRAAGLDATVRQALEGAEAMVVICSPRSATSRAVNEQMEYFRALGRGRRIYCLIVDGEPNASDKPGRAHEECFPPALCFECDPQAPDGRRRVEPLAADARRGKDGRGNAKLKLIAGLLGLGFDDLRQREQQRRQRHLLSVAAAAGLGMVLTGGLAFIAAHERHEAEHQRAQAEGLIEFMLGDLREKLMPVGRMEVLDVVGEKAIDYYAHQDPDTLDADALGRRARALHLIGEIHVSRGDLQAASDVFAQAARSTGDLMKRYPDDWQRLFDHARSVYWVGQTAFQRGEREQAQRWWENYRELAARLLQLRPDDRRSLMQLVYAYGNLSLVLAEEGQLQEAVAQGLRKIELLGDMARLVPDDPSVPVELARAYAWLADAQEQLGDLAGTATSSQQALAAFGRLLERSPRDSAVEIEHLRFLGWYSGLLVATGSLDDAERILRLANATAGELVRQQPANADVLLADASISRASAALAFWRGDLVAADAQLHRSEETLASLVRRDPKNPEWQLQASSASTARARLLSAQGHHRAALDRALSSIQALSALGNRVPSLAHSSSVMLRARVLAGEEYATLGQRSAAEQQWQEALQLLEKSPAGARAPSMILRARLLKDLERRGEAAAVVQQAWLTGFRHPDLPKPNLVSVTAARP